MAECNWKTTEFVHKCFFLQLSTGLSAVCCYKRSDPSFQRSDPSHRCLHRQQKLEITFLHFLIATGCPSTESDVLPDWPGRRSEFESWRSAPADVLHIVQVGWFVEVRGWSAECWVLSAGEGRVRPSIQSAVEYCIWSGCFATTLHFFFLFCFLQIFERIYTAGKKWEAAVPTPLHHGAGALLLRQLFQVFSFSGGCFRDSLFK